MNVYQFEDFDTFYEASKLASLSGNLVNVYTPVHYEEIDELLKIRPRAVTAGLYIGGSLGIITALLITVIPNVWTFPINVGGRPLFSWPAFAIICFELMVLFGGFGSVFGFLFSNRYPRYDRDIFFLEAFEDKKKGEYFLVTREELRHPAAGHHYALPHA
jgi:hypothetical protein